jgi:uncharacterized membrane-anchored protein
VIRLRRLISQSHDDAVKVPQLTVYFWVIKILTTAMGEATSDYLVKRFSPPLVVMVGLVGCAGALAWQLGTPRYVPQVYWTAVAMVSVFGTMAADVVHVGLHVPYLVSAVTLAAALALVFWLWDRQEGTLSIHSITTRRRELFYWAAAVVTFALGTATGDLTAISFHLGYLSSGLLFVAVFAIPAVLFLARRRHGVFCFWFAYIATRPLGASFADWIAKPQHSGGLGRGDGIVAGVLTVLIVALVAFLSISGTDVQPTLAST